MSTTLAILIVVSVVLWMAYEIWRAPILEESDDGRMIVKRPTKQFKDLFIYKKKRK